MLRFRYFLCVCTLLGTALCEARGQGTVDPPLPDGSAAAVRQMAGFRLTPGMKVAMFAAEPQLASPVALCLDERGRVYIAEEYRFNRGTEENRTRPFLLDDDLQIATLEDRLKMFEKHAGKFTGGLEWFTKYTDQIRLLEDTDADGKADRSQVFADGFNGVLDGMASGVIARDGDVYVTSIPHLWRLRDQNGDGVAEVKEKLLTGFGVNASFLGHDLHGLAWGPDGKLYFSLGDRGFHVTSKEGKTSAVPRRGAVFRCRPDGSDFEVVHIGLRNPQELAFDDYGNLFADDNNSDKGDDGRLVYIVEGGDSGWSMPYQTMPEPYLTGPWHAEKMWHAACDEQPAWLLPRIGKIGNGPSGFAYYPGVGLEERYRGHFFMANYVGGGGIESFAVKPSGAGFEIIDYHDFCKPLSATDVDFGYDGKMYVSDFVGLDWAGATKGGRVYTLTHETHGRSDAVKQLTELFKRGFKDRPSPELVDLLRHADQRVRQRAQFELAARGAPSLPLLNAAFKQREHRLARLHALWAMGQLCPEIPEARASIAAALTDEDDEVRSQAARLSGDIGARDSLPRLIELLKDEHPRTVFFAAQSLGKLKDEVAVEPLYELILRNDDRDRYIRHAAVHALVRLGAADAAAKRMSDPAPAIRRASLLVLRANRDERLHAFLNDQDPLLVLEAARAINDLPMDQLTAQLADLWPQFRTRAQLAMDPLVRRVIHANFRLGGVEHVQAVADIAANGIISDAARNEALRALHDWSSPSPRDRVAGYWRPLEPRNPDVVSRGIPPAALVKILAASQGELQKTAGEMAMKNQLVGGDDLLIAWVRDAALASNARGAALRLLSKRKHAQASALFTEARNDKDVNFRAVAMEILADADPVSAEALACECLVKESSFPERQTAFALLAKRKSPQADETLRTWANRLAAGEVAAELQLDVIEAARLRKDEQALASVAKYEGSLATEDPLARRRVSLAGGDAAAGRTLFVNHSQGQCIRCHKIQGIGGGVAGPDLSQIAAKKPREYLLESLLLPNAKIAEGFAAVSLSLDDGRIVSGVIKSEQDGVVELTTPTGALLRIPTTSIEQRSPPQSAMPPMDKILTPRELRDLVEFLSTLKQ